MASSFLLPNSTQPASTTKAGVVKIGSGINAAADGTISIATSGVTAGTYKSVTVDNMGRVTAGTNPTTLSGYGITDAVNKTNAAILTSAKITSSANLAAGSSSTSVLTVESSDKINLFSVSQTGLTTIRTNTTKEMGLPNVEAFRIESNDNQPLFQVMQNGDAKIAGVITVSGTGTSTFAGDVAIGGRLTVEEGVSGGAEAVLSADDFTVRGKLIVEGTTQLGDNAAEDKTDIKGLTTIYSPKTKLAGSSLVNVFHVVSSDNQELFEVRQNGDTVIAGKLTVNSTGSSFAGDVNFEGNVNIGGNLTVDGNATAKADLSSNNLTLTGDLIVQGSTQLGDNALEDTTTIKGFTKIISKTTKSAGSSTIEAFRVESADKQPLFQVMENGDTKIGNNLTVAQKATINAEMSGQDLLLNGNLVVKGNTTLGDAISDIINVAGATTFTGSITVPTPTSDYHAVNKIYVDSLKQGLDVKDSVKVATTANINLTGTQTIDNVTVIAGDRVLVKNQTNAAQNGIYIVSTGSWSRSTDANSSSKVSSGMFTFVEQGNTNADSGWILTTDSNITLESTALSFVQFSGAGQINAGNGIEKSGNTLSLKKATTSTIGGVQIGTGISVDANGVISVTAGSTGGVSSSEVSTESEGNTIVKRTLDGSVKANNLELFGSVSKVNGTATSGVFGINTTTSNANDLQLSNTAANTVATFTPSAKGNFIVYLYFRIINASTNLNIQVTYNDGSGTQNQLIVDGAQTVGSYSVSPLFINAVNGTAISVKATAGTANNVYVSSSIVAI